ncbi:hypothetical protein PILCRDRAFT_86882 [Piloderma croceum F 1598]|uniref:Knr4/Smi1-like domain-containing protein n=1 Tax=Piloderma croceum (strain F 1598) TaxID=765440 RepID=A0A0C3C7Q5_PILCF|nr:hypothetical protein PILCRDRAFT_86882 [Piloderma croceum F 1598]
MESVDAEDGVRFILHERRLDSLTTCVVNHASFLVLHGHLSLANTLLSTFFRLHRPTWGLIARDIPLAFESMWAETASRPPNVPPFGEGTSIDNVQFMQRGAFYDLIQRINPMPEGGLAREWNQVQLNTKVNFRVSHKLYDSISSLLDRLFKNHLTSDMAFGADAMICGVQRCQLYAAAVALYIDIHLRIGDSDRARALFTTYAIPMIEGKAERWNLLVRIPGIYPLLASLNILSVSDASQRVDALTAALTTRLTIGVARPYIDLSWAILLDKYAESVKADWLQTREDDEEWHTPLCAPATADEISSMERQLALDTPLPQDYIAFLRHTNGFKGSIWPSKLGSAGDVRSETWPDEVAELKVEFKEDAFEDTDVAYEKWPRLERVIAIDAEGGDDGDIWLIEPHIVAKARQFAINARRDKQAKDQGLPIPEPGEAPSRCPMPRYTASGSSGYLFLPVTHENSNLPPELIDLIVQYALRDARGDCYDRATAFCLCSTSRRMHELAASALWQTGWLVLTWSHWGVAVEAYESFRQYIESAIPPP